MLLKILDQRDYRLVICSLFFIVLFTGCSKKPYINVYDQNITKVKLPCLKVDLAGDDKLNKYLVSLYSFNSECEYRVTLSSKSGIHCNSSFNSSQKNSSTFPTAYLRLELRRGVKLLFSYYIDLTSSPDKEDVVDAFKTLQNYVKLK